MSVNLVIQLGHLSRDPELSHTTKGTAVVNCSIATNRSVPKGDGFVDEPTFVEFTVWGKRGEAFAKYHQKGSKAYLQGRLTTDSWEDRASGQKRTKTKMTVEQWEFVDKSGQPTGRTSGEPYTPPEDVDDTPF